MTREAWTKPPTIDDIAEIAEAALAEIPDQLRRCVSGVAILVEDLVDEELEKEMELESPYDLLGLYEGVALPLKSVTHTPEQPDRIFLYRLAILDAWCESGEPLRQVVRHVLIHEIGHHFGFSDDDLERIEGEADRADEAS